MNNRKYFLTAILYAALSTLYMTFSVQDGSVTLLSTEGGNIGNTMLFLAFFFIYQKTLPLILQKQGVLSCCLTLLIAAVFSLFSVMGMFFRGNGNLFSYAQGGFPSLLAAILLIFSGGLLFFSLIRLIGGLREWKPAVPFDFSRKSIFSFLQKRPLVFMAVVWAPQILLRYPGSLPVDTINSLEQYWGTAAATTQHPILYTVVVGKLIDFGISIGHPAIGLYLLILIQTVLLFLILAYTLWLLRMLGVPSWLYLTAVLFFALAPIFVSYAATAISDSLYNTFFLLMLDELVCYLFFNGQYRKSRMHYILTAAAILGLNFRRNGVYIGLAVFAAGVLIELFFLRKRRTKLVYSLLFLAVLLVPALGGKYVSNRLYDHYDAKYVSKRVLFSLPIQQVARCLSLYGDEIDEEIIEDIQRVLKWDVEDYKEIYSPYTFDTVKKGFRSNCSQEDLKAFLSAWLKLVVKYPTTCLDATVNMTYFLFSPRVVNQSYYVSTTRKLELDGVDFSDINQKNPLLKKACRLLKKAYKAFGYLPGFGLLINQGFTDLVLLAVSMYALLERKGRLLLLCLPLLLTLGITFVGPMVRSQARYTYPIMYALPLLLGAFITYSQHCHPDTPPVCK